MSEHEEGTVMAEPFFQAFVKHDKDKNRTDLLPVEALEEIAKAFTHGAAKYSPNNFRHGAAWSRYYGAALRHLFAFWRGEDRDAETGLLHLAHAGACIMIALTSQLARLGSDDRWREARVGLAEVPKGRV